MSNSTRRSAGYDREPRASRVVHALGLKDNETDRLPHVASVRPTTPVRAVCPQGAHRLDQREEIAAAGPEPKGASSPGANHPTSRPS